MIIGEKDKSSDKFKQNGCNNLPLDIWYRGGLGRYARLKKVGKIGSKIQLLVANLTNFSNIIFSFGPKKHTKSKKLIPN